MSVKAEDCLTESEENESRNENYDKISLPCDVIVKAENVDSDDNVENDAKNSETEPVSTTGYDIFKAISAKEREEARKNNECFICKKRLASYSAFKAHMIRHTGLKNYKCHMCDKSFAESKYLKAHFRTHNGFRTECKICLKQFTSLSGLQGHMLIHSGEKRYKCDICGKAFTASSTRGKHMRTVHRKDKKVRITVEMAMKNLQAAHNINNLDIDETKFKKDLTCTLCMKEFSTSSNLIKHIRIHTGEKKYVCEFCERSFTDPSTLRKHRLTHTNEKNFLCDICSKGFSVMSSLTQHMRTHTEKKFVCDICSKGFWEMRSLNVHMRIHTGEKPHVCNVCNKAFHGKSSLSKHMISHLPEKLYQCDICSKRFSLKWYLKKHIEMHENDQHVVKSEGDEFICRVCSKSFTTTTGLKIHYQTLHDEKKNHPCKLCNKRFATAFKLRTHMGIVHIDKPYECTECVKTFATPEKCDQHRQKHFTDKKLFPCSICHQTFKAAGNLRKHVIRRHNPEHGSNELKIPIKRETNAPPLPPAPMPVIKYFDFGGFLRH